MTSPRPAADQAEPALLVEPFPTRPVEHVTHLRERLVGYKLPVSFERVDEPLRDDAGKVRRSALRDERLPPPVPA